jgi:type VI secretion system secreted protein Hcp
VPIYMKIEGINGEVTTKGFEKYIELQSAQLGHSRAVNTRESGGGTRGTPQMTEIVITKYNDGTSATLFRESLMGKGKKVTIVFAATGVDKSTPYLTLELENTLISSYNMSGTGGDGHDKPIESLTLNFTKVTFKTTTLDEKLKGTPDSTTFDLQTGQVQ